MLGVQILKFRIFGRHVEFLFLILFLTLQIDKCQNYFVQHTIVSTVTI